MTFRHVCPAECESILAAKQGKTVKPCPRCRMVRIETARFWERCNGGWVKLSIPRGGCFAHFVSEPTDEGWYSQELLWSFDDDNVVRSRSYRRERDCDGLYESESERSCRITAVADVVADDGTRYPRWDTEYRGHRDHSAEKAGY